MALALGLGPAAQAQVREPTGAPRIQGANFAIVRATSTGSVAFYGARRVGPGLAMVGVTANPGTGARALIAGAGTRLRINASSGFTVILAGAQSTDGPSLRLYVLPTVVVGRVAVAATATVYQPMGGGAPREAALNPLAVTVRATPALSAGLAVAVQAAEGRPTRTGLGPTLRLRTPVGVLCVEFLPFGLPRPEVRGSFSVAR
jgi:hypothetical protein